MSPTATGTTTAPRSWTDSLICDDAFTAERITQAHHELELALAAQPSDD